MKLRITLISKPILTLLAAVAFATLLTWSSLPSEAQNKGKTCVYQTDAGLFKTTKSLKRVPYKYRKKARCTKAGAPGQKSQRMAKPDEIELEGNIRRETLNTSVGKIELRWPRSVESIFGRTPLRAMTDAARTVSRATKTAAFPSFIQNMNLPWNVVFMDENLPAAQIPQKLISNCHPGWMTPPANIYIVAQRVAAGCGGNRSVTASVADGQLTEVLVHEMGHALEYHLLAKNYRFSRMRAEGFATWFETYAAQYSSFINRRDLQKRNAGWARLAIQQSPNSFTFGGSALDYARASMYFAAVEDRFGLRGIISVYESMVKNSLDVFKAIEKETLWNRSRLEKEAKRIADNG